MNSKFLIALVAALALTQVQAQIPALTSLSSKIESLATAGPSPALSSAESAYSRISSEIAAHTTASSVSESATSQAGLASSLSSAASSAASQASSATSAAATLANQGSNGSSGTLMSTTCFSALAVVMLTSFVAMLA